MAVAGAPNPCDRRRAARLCCPRPWCARSASRSCWRPASAICNLRPEGHARRVRRAGHRRAAAQGDHLHARVLPGRRRLLDRGPRRQRQHPLVPRQPDAVAAGERPPVRVHARGGADVPAPRGRPRASTTRSSCGGAGTGPRPSATSAAPTATSTTPTPGAATTSATCTARACTTTRRSTPTRTGPRRSRSGWRAVRWRRRYRDWQVALAKLEYVDRIIGIERACRGNPAQRPPGHARPVHGDQGDRRRVLRHRPQPRPGPARVPQRPAGDLPAPAAARARIAARGLQPRTANAQSAARFIQQHQSILVDRIKRWIGDSRQARHPAASCASCRRSAPPSTWSSPTAAAPRSWSS